MRTRFARLATAVAAGLLVPALAPAVQAAPASEFPSVAALAKIYPHLEGGQTFQTTVDEVRVPNRKCEMTKVLKGTSASAGYAPAVVASPSAAAPGVSLVVYRLPSQSRAKAVLAAFARQARKCPGGGVVGGSGGIKSTKVRSFAVELGDTSRGFTVSVDTDGATTSYVNNNILVRQGTTVLNALTSSWDGKPSVKKSIKAARLFFKTAG